MQQEFRRSQDNDHVGSSRVRRKFGQSSEVQREQIREVQKLAKRSSSELAKWIVAKSRSMPDVRRRITEGCRLIVGSWPETRRKKRLTHRSKAAEVVLDLIVVSTLIKLENGR